MVACVLDYATSKEGIEWNSYKHLSKQSDRLFDFIMERVQLMGLSLDEESTKALTRYKGHKSFPPEIWMSQVEFFNIMHNLGVHCNVWEQLAEDQSYWRLYFNGNGHLLFSVESIR